MYTLTKREKVLIYVMLFVGILAGMAYLLIIPAGNASSAYAEEIALESTQKTIMERTVSVKEQMSDEAAEQYDGLLKLVKDYYAPMTNDELDAHLTGLLFQNHVTPVSLSIDKRADYTDLSEVFVQTVSIAAYGNMSDVLVLLDAIKADPALKIASLSLQGSPGSAQASLSFNVEVYSYDKTLLPSAR